MYKHSLKISSSLFLPIFGIPLHNRVNPIIVAKLGNFIDIDLSIDIYIANVAIMGLVLKVTDLEFSEI